MPVSLFDLLKQQQPQQPPAGLAPLPTGNLGVGAPQPLVPQQGTMVASGPQIDPNAAANIWKGFKGVR